MGEKTEIAWCDSTFNPWVGCTKISPGCDNCYAEAFMDKRLHRVQWGPHGERKRTSAANWREPVQWNNRARGFRSSFGRRRRVFCSSLADVFDNQVPPEWRHDLFRLIWDTPALDWLLLTKRPENIARMIDDALRPLMGTVFGPWYGRGWPNVWLGFTAEDQEHFDRRWPIMRNIPAVVRFCSYEPAIGPLRLWNRGDFSSVGLGWLIAGGESGHGYRPMDTRWIEDVKIDCEVLGIPFFMKQMAGKKPIPDYLMTRQFPEVPHG